MDKQSQSQANKEGRRIQFTAEKIEFVENVKDLKFSKVKLYAFKTGVNSHMITASEDVLKEYSDTIIDCPLVCYFDESTGDLAGHEPEEVPIGFIPQDAKITFEKDESDGEVWLCVEALIWKYYSGEVLELFEDSGDTKPVSVELVVFDSVVEDNEEKMTKFEFWAVTILGTNVAPSVKGAKAQILQYQADYESDKEEYYKNCKRKIFTEKEVEKDMDFNKEDFLAKYEMSAQEMDNLLSDATRAYKYEIPGEDGEYTKYYLMDYDSTYIYADDWEEGGYKALSYEIKEGNEVIVDFENPKEARRVWMVGESVSKDMSDDAINTMAKVKMASENAKEDANIWNEFEDYSLYFEKQSDRDALITTHTEELNKLQDEVTELTESNQTLTAEVEGLQDVKVQLEAKEKADAELQRNSDIAGICNYIRDNSDIPKEKIDEWVEKANKFEEVEEYNQYEDLEVWKKDFIAEAFEYPKAEKAEDKDNADEDDSSVERYALPDESAQSKAKQGLWDRLGANTNKDK